MASSSSCTLSPQPQKKHDVFISFRGEDTRYNFTSHLHEALQREHIDTYIDYRLEKGSEVWRSLEQAIEDSILFLVIFSEQYASSTWCLKELTKILQCSQNQTHRVMPVFYRVDPSDVRKQSSESYRTAFEEHELKASNKQHLQEWREALSYSATLCGWPCSSDRNEAELIKEIVECVIRKLDCIYQSEENLKDLVGIDKRMEDVESLLYKDSDCVRSIGIWGMGGMGKTTLAKALFDRFSFAYEGSCFLDNVREDSKKIGIAALKKKLISTLLGDKASHIIGNLAMRRLSRKKNFIVLDDVEDREQLEDLVGRRDWFGPGSIILITTRDKQALLGKEVDDIYKVEALNPDEAFDLFSTNAFRNDFADPKIWVLANQVAHYAEGNPLALKVLGSLLNGKNQEAWESQLKKLQKLPCKKINDILKLSFEGLDDDEEKNIFLYVACFFNYYDVQEVKNLLDACGYSTSIGLERLKDKALCDTHERRISIHSLLKKMGQQIVRENSYQHMRIRIWNSNEIYEMLQENKGNMAIEGIILEASEDLEEKCSSPLAFSLPNLRFLIFHNHFNENKLKFPGGIEFLPNKLTILSWKGYPSNSLPPSFKGENLVQIKMSNSKLTKLWDGVQNLVSLREIDLSNSTDLIEIPDFVRAIHLEKVHLENCSKLASVHPSILSLHSLGWLDLRGCKALISLTSNTRLKSLFHLDLSGCSRLNEFAVTSESEHFQLYLSGTDLNGELCSSSGYLSKITILNLGSSTSVTSIHKLFDLRNLLYLEAYVNCGMLASNLCPMFDKMRALRDLRLTYCSDLLEVPDNIYLLSSLLVLQLSGTKIETLPLSIKHLLRLQRLYLNECANLLSLPELPPSILRLSTVNCQSLETLHPSHIPYYKVPYDTKFNFTNCMGLDEQSVRDAEAKMALDMNRALCYKAKMVYPGERVPEWFMCRSTQSLVIVDLHSIPQPWDAGTFIFCAVVSKSLVWTNVVAECFVDGQYVCEVAYSWNGFPPVFSDHIVLWCDRDSFGEVQRKIEEKEKHQESKTYHPLLHIQFTAFLDDEREAHIIKECGVCPTTTVGFQNYIKQILSRNV